MIAIDYGLDCESPETVVHRELCRELAEARRELAETRAALAEIKVVNRKQHERMMQFLWTNLDLQDINDGLKAELEGLQHEQKARTG